MIFKMPQFLIIGTQKAGTSWLELVLGQHPRIYMPGKQLHFFDQNYGRGSDWYARQFPSNLASGVLAGEKTTEYFDTKYVARTPVRIAESFDEVKMILILRDPVERAISSVRHHIMRGLEPYTEDIEGALFADLERKDGYRYIERGMYSLQLGEYLNNFDREEILTLIYEEDVLAQPEASLEKVCLFLGIESYSFRDLSQRVNSQALSVPSIRLSRYLRTIPNARGIVRRIDNFMKLNEWTLSVSDDVKKRLRLFYQDDTRNLAELLGRDLPNWATPAADVAIKR